MKNDNLILNLKKGLSDLLFNSSIEDSLKLLGKPSEVEEIGEDIEYPTTILHYDDLNISLFFENNDNSKLVCIDIDNPDAKLFGEKLIGKNSKEVVALMVKNEIYNQNMEEEAWGEKRISFEDYSIDFFFQDDELVSITYGR